MKIKEVSEKTELTERAIRLYIEEGLVAPSVNESYSGRRNIDFSSEDVEILKNISALRKAEFSINEIKLLQSQPEKSKEILSDFIGRLKKRAEADTKTVTCLMPLLSGEEISVGQIVDCLDAAVITEKNIPSEDSEISPLHKFIRKLFLIVGIIGLIFNLVCCVPIFWVEIRDIREYRYPQYDSAGAFFLGIVLAGILLSVLLTFLNRKNIVTSRKKQKIRSFICVLMVCCCMWCSYFSYALAFLASCCDPEGYIVSVTCNTENYMEFDYGRARDAMAEFLPEELPDIKGIKYKYYYKEYGGNPETPRTEVFLELPLDDDAFRKAVDKYRAFRPHDSISEPEQEKKGEWTVIYYRQDFEKAPSCYTAVFAFNEDEKKVRFMCVHSDSISFRGAVRGDITISRYKW